MRRNSGEDLDRDQQAGELDLRELGGVLKRGKSAILLPTLVAFVIVTIGVNVITPRYQGETLVLLENQESLFTTPGKTGLPTIAPVADPDAVGSQIQLVLSRDLAVQTIKDLNLRNNPEFDSSGLFSMLLGGKNESAESRAVKAFQERLTVTTPPKTHVIAIQFQSRTPELAADVANKLAELYITEQSAAKRSSAKDAAASLNAQIADLRVKSANADAVREKYRAENGLLTTGLNQLTINGQQLADINTDLSKARTLQADAQAKATLIKELLRSGRAADVPGVIDNDLVRRVADQRVTAQANLALESRTLLPGHPRIQALAAQLAGLDEALKVAAKRAVSTLENEAKIAGQRVTNLENVLSTQKKAAGASNADEVKLRSLDHVALAYKDQLETSMAKYQEALAREKSDATPADARIISRASAPEDPVFPKKLPFIAIGTLAVLVLSAGIVVARDLMRASSVPPGRLPVRPSPAYTAPAEAALRPASRAPAAGRRAPLPTPEEDHDTGQRPSRERPRGYDEDEDEAHEEPARSSAWMSRVFNWPQTRLADRLKAFSQSASETREQASGFEPHPLARDETRHRVLGQIGETGLPAEDGLHAEDGGAETLALRIAEAHVPGRGVVIGGASIAIDGAPAGEVIALARALSARGRTVIVDLNATPGELAPLADATRGDSIMRFTGLAELLGGETSFAEAIHRDYASRLHFIPAGRCQPDFRDFDLVLDALSETYDFVVLLAPSFPASEVLKIMAPHTDFVVLTGAKTVSPRQIALLRNELIEAGAKDILFEGPIVPRRRRPDVA